MSRKRQRTTNPIVIQDDDPKPPVQKKPKKLQVTLNSRIDYATDQIDTGFRNGIVQNPFSDYEMIKGYAEVGMMYGNIHDHVIDLLAETYTKYGRENVYILGCIAWLTDPALIGALAQCAGVQFIVNDEDFRIFGGGKLVPNLYNALPIINIPYNLIFAKCDSPLLRCCNPTPTPKSKTFHYFLPTNLFKSTQSKIEEDAPCYAAVRSIGSRSIVTQSTTHDGQIDEPREDGDKQPKSPSRIFQAGPIMHAKYIIPCVWSGPGAKFKPLGVLLGSMNFTQKARKNQEIMAWIGSEAAGSSCLKNDYTRSFLASEPIRK